MIWAQTAGYYAAYIGMGLMAAALGPTLPALAAQTRCGLDAISLLFITRALGGLLGSLHGGRLYDRWPGHRVLAAALLAASALLLLTPLAPALGWLNAVMLGLGVAMGVLNLGVNVLLTWVHRERTAPFMNGLHFCFGIGACLAPLIVAWSITGRGDVLWAYWLLALLLLPVAAWLVRVPSPQPAADPQPDAQRRADARLVGLVTLFFFFYVGAEASFGSWLFTYAVTLKLGAAATAAYLTSAFWGALIVGRLLSIPAALRYPPQRILLADLALGLLALGAILLWPGSVAVLWLGALAAGLGMASVFPTMLALAQQHLAVTGRVMAWFMVGATLGSMVLPWLIGQLIEPLGPRIVIWTALAAWLLTAAALAGVGRRLRPPLSRPAARPESPGPAPGKTVPLPDAAAPAGPAAPPPGASAPAPCAPPAETPGFRRSPG